jgi:hypothetical protein
VWFFPTPNETFENACIRNIGNKNTALSKSPRQTYL